MLQRNPRLPVCGKTAIVRADLQHGRLIPGANRSRSLDLPFTSSRARQAGRIARLNGRVAASLVSLALLAGAAEAATSRETAAAQREAAAMRLDALRGTSGNFLAAMNAQAHRDVRAAGEYFREVLKHDARNPALLERAFVSELGDGDFAAAYRLAERVIQQDPANPLAQAALGVRALKQKQYKTARALLGKAGSSRGRRADLTIALLTAWTQVGSGQLKRALEIVDKFNQPELSAYRNFFGGLMADVAGDRAEAGKRLISAYKSEPGTLRVADAYARHMVRDGKRDEALKAYADWESRNPGQPFVRSQIADIKAGKTLAPLATSVADGAAEILYGMGIASGGGRDSDSSLIFLQLAAYLAPDDELIKVSVAEVFEQMRQWERAGEAYGAIANGSPFRTRALIGRVIAYERQDKTDEAIKTLTTLLDESPDELEATDMLGGLYRAKKKMPESIAVYSRAIDRLKTPERSHWNLFFGRAVAYERNKEWPKAEADFLKALELLPDTVRTPREKFDRAQVLNYLAYSWVDQGMHIERSFEMLKRAVELAPEDGAIVDSLGWAYYRLGKFDDAVRELEKAVSLKPGDPTINDHLGDAYWRIGSKREAGFKWNHARDLKPDPEDLPKILRKIEFGLEDDKPANLPAELVPSKKSDGG